MPSYKIEGTVLSKRPFGESDAMMDVLTVSRGYETFVAKGAFRSRRRLVGGLEPFTRTEFTVYQSRPGKLPVIQDLKVLTSRFELYRDLDVFTALTRIASFLSEQLPPGVPEYEVCELFETLLASVAGGGRAESLVLSFYLRAFGALGWRMDVGACASCKKIPHVEGIHELDFSEGRLYCPVCVKLLKLPSNQTRTPLTLAQAKGLAALILPPRLKAGISIDPPVERFLNHLIDRYLLWHTGVDRSRDPAAPRTV